MKALLDFLTLHWKRISTVATGLGSLFLLNPPADWKHAGILIAAYLCGVATPDKMLAAKIQGEKP
jgi:hypothetical protein